MKVTRNTPDHLVVDVAPWGIGIGLVLFILLFVGIGLLVLPVTLPGGLAFILVGGGLGLAAFAIFVRRVQLILDRPAGTVTLRRRSLFGSDAETHPLAELAGAEVASHARRDRETDTVTRTERVELLFGKARVPLTEDYSSGGAHARVARAINDWLDSARSAA